MRYAWLLVLAVGAGCGDTETSLEVLVATDLVPVADFTRVRTTLYNRLPSEGGNPVDLPQEHEARADEGYGSGASVARFSDVGPATWAVRVELLAEDGSTVAMRDVSTPVVGETRILVRVDLGDAGTGSDAGALDAGPSDGGRQDVGAPDAGPPPPCPAAGAETVALYTFDSDEGGSTIADATGAHDGTLAAGTVTTNPGRDGCGEAIRFAAEAHATVPSSPAFDLTEGSVELWVRIASTTAGLQGLVVRDANGTDLPGHFMLALSFEGRVFVRMQSTVGDAWRCSTPIPLDTWVQIGVNFGPGGLELWVDHSLAAEPELRQRASSMPSSCGAPWTDGIAGNDNPVVIGGSSWTSVEGTGAPVIDHFVSGDLDHVHVRSTRRDFSVPPL